jgi:hypothetical protein
MPFLFIVSGLVMVVASVRDTQSQLLNLLKADFKGQGNLLYWMVSILLIGAVGYIPDLKPVSRAFLVLVVIVLFLKSGGVFTQFTQALGATQNQSAVPTSATPASSGSGSAAGSTGSAVGQLPTVGPLIST